MEKGKIVSLEDRVPKLKQQRKRKANKRLIFLLFLFFLLIAFVVYFQSPLSHVNKIHITGSEIYSDKELISQSGLSRKTNIWNIELEQIQGRLEKLPEIKSAKITKEFPNNILIELKEWEITAYHLKDGAFWGILENGQKLKTTSHTIPFSSPVLINFTKGDALEEIIESLNKLPHEVLNSISEIHYTPKETDKFHIKLYMNDGYEVHASIRSFAEKMSHYPSIISQLNSNVKGVIDLEVGSYFKAYEVEGAEEENAEQQNTEQKER